MVAVMVLCAVFHFVGSSFFHIAEALLVCRHTGSDKTNTLVPDINVKIDSHYLVDFFIEMSINGYMKPLSL
jgi:hypothetical protein